MLRFRSCTRLMLQGSKEDEEDEEEAAAAAEAEAEAEDVGTAGEWRIMRRARRE